VRLAVVAVAVLACGHPAPDCGESLCYDVTCPTLPLCSKTCGNDMIDECAAAVIELDGEGPGANCTMFTDVTEQCDGTMVNSCVDLGYYGGSSACTSSCTVDVSACNACAVACVDFEANTSLLAASGSNLGIVVDNGPGGYTLAVLDASLNEVATASAGDNQPAQIVGVAGGWLLVGYYLNVVRVDLSGSSALLPPIVAVGGGALSGGDTSGGGIAYGPGERALVLYNDGTSNVVAAILDANGTVAVAPFEVFAATSDVGSVTTDGRSFFVAANGQLVLVGADGTVSAPITGYPIAGSAARSTVSWSGSNGWYVVANDDTGQSYVAQAFDGTGAMIGSLVSITTSLPIGLQAFNTGLVGTQCSPLSSAMPGQPDCRFAVARLDATGAVVASTDVGVGTSAFNVVPFGSGVAAAWSGLLPSSTGTTAWFGHVALVTP